MPGPPASPAASAPAPAVEFEKVTKRFGTTVANRRISFTVQAGSIHGIVGENGAGKSTLMHLLYGVHRPDRGRILVDGAPVSFARPRDAIAAGLGMIHQHLSLVPALTALENVILGREPRRPGGIRWGAARRRVTELAEAHGLPVDLAAPVGALDVSAQQRVEILKALYRGARILILDEPTTLLAASEYARFADSLRQFVAGGGTILYVSHRLPEVFDLCDRVTVLREGRVVATETTAGLTPPMLARRMVGEEVPTPVPRVVRPGVRTDKVIELRDVRTRPRRGDAPLKGVSLTVLTGEILGVAGVGGNGQRALAHVLAGMERPTDGAVLWGEAEPWNGVDLRARRQAGLGWIPGDRTRAGVVGALSICENLVLGRHAAPPFAKAGIRFPRAVRQAAALPIAQLRVQPPDPDAPAGPLSGGNQQKLLVARELAADPRLLVAEHATQGLDVATTLRIHAKFKALRDAGGAVVFIAADLEELLEVADRIAVMYRGRILRIVRASETTVGELAPLLGGITDHADAAAPA